MPQIGAFFAGIGSFITTGAVAGAGIGGAWAAGAATASFLTTSVVGRLLTSVALSALTRALAPKPQTPGIKTSSTAGGGVNPVSFLLGTYATAGVAVCPAMSHGKAGKTSNAYLTYVIELSDIPGVALNRLIIDGEYVTLGPTPHADYGSPVEGRLAGYAWCKFYDGSQVAADPMLLAKYGSYPDRPWSADMIGRGVAYAILTFRYNRKVYNSLPQVRFELLGIPLYDPRKDTTVGGSGSQRWATPSTWTRTDNPMVMAYNIKRGIALMDGSVWGGGWAAADLPLTEWFAMMDVCDQAVPLAAGGTEPRYRAGFEVTVDDEPADVLEELFKACAGQVADIGGTWKPRAGAPGLPVAFLTDDDVIITSPQELTPFPGLAATWNGISATYPEPDSLWESKEAPPRYNATWEAADGGRRLVADLGLPAVPWKRQVQRLMRAYIEDERRFRRHKLVLPHWFAHVEPLDTISWTSAENGYSAKLFEVAEVSEDVLTLLRQVSLREVNPADYDWSTAHELPTTTVPAIIVQPAPQTVPGFDLQATQITDATATARRPALRLVWDGAELDDVRAIEWQVRRSGTTALLQSGSTHLVEDGELTVSSGILPATDYEARARCVVDRPSDWTAWDAATTDGVYVQDADFGPGGVSAMFQAAGLSAPRIVGALPAAGPARFVGELVFLTTDFKLYRWTGSAWTAAVPTADLTGRVATSQLLIADLSNLCEDPSFELDGLGWGAVGGMEGFSVISTDARTGAKCASRAYAGGTANFVLRNNLIFDTSEGDNFRISGWVKIAPAAVCTNAGVRMSWLDAGGAEITTSAVTMALASLTTSYQPVSGIVTAPAGAVYARLELIVNGHSAGTIFWDDVYCYRANAGELTVDGSIMTNHLAAQIITTGLLAVGAAKASIIDIDDMLTISATDAGFMMGKTSPADFGSDGIYMGRSQQADSTTGYGFLMGTTSAGGLQRYIQSTPDTGLDIVNAEYGVLLPFTGNTATHAASTTVTLTAGVKTISLTILGGGGGGGVSNTSGDTPATAGGNTVVQLWDGAVNTGVSWTATGGAGGVSASVATTGENSVLGTGGAAGYIRESGGKSGNYSYHDGGNATGYGAGGGGGTGWSTGGTGGKKSVAVNVSNYDVSGLTAPKLVITIGAAGAGGIEPVDSTMSNGGNGSPGVVKLTQKTEAVIPAGVVPHYQTQSGQFLKGANVTGATIFPDHKPGIWFLYEESGNALGLNGLKIDSQGTILKIPNSSTVMFIANIRPEITIANANARTINWRFYPLRAQ